jgi:hypothetical protein
MSERHAEKPRIEVRLKASRELDPVAATIETLGRDTLPAGVPLERVSTGLDRADTVTVTIIGSISSPSLINFVTRVSAARARLRRVNVHLVIHYQGASFELPHDAERLTTRLQRRASSG